MRWHEISPDVFFVSAPLCRLVWWWVVAREIHSVYVVLLISLLIIFGFYALIYWLSTSLGLTIIYTLSKLKVERGVY